MHRDLIGIGEFARLSGLTIRALRYYDRIGLLKPADPADPAGTSAGTNSRRYRADQVARARLIAKLRSVDVPVGEVRLALADPGGQVVGQILERQRRRLEARATRVAGDLHRLQHLIHEGMDAEMAGNANTPVALDHDTQRRLAAWLYNDVWRLLETEDRSVADDDLMVHAAHASAYHWLQVGKPANFARSHWQCSRVYATLGRAEPALHHARRCLELCEQHGIGDFDLAFAYEALARAHAVAGDAAEARRMTEHAVAACEHIADPQDKKILLADLETIPAG